MSLQSHSDGVSYIVAVFAPRETRPFETWPVSGTRADADAFLLRKSREPKFKGRDYRLSVLVSGASIRHLMRKHRVTIRRVSEHYDIPLSRVRYVRQHGGPWDWPLLIRTLGAAP